MSSTAGWGRVLLLGWRSGWRGLAAWVVGLCALMGMTAGSIASVYTTEAERTAYARMAGSPGMSALSGDVAGVDTLGGITANEFGQIAGFAVPLMAIALVVRGTRTEEQAGRHAMLRAGPLGRLAPLAAALLTALGALAAMAAGSAVLMVANGADGTGALYYGAGLFALGAVHAAVAALVAQLVGQARGVWAVSLLVVVVGFVLRGVGAVRGGPWGWASPLGWLDALRSFGDDPRWWPLALSLGVFLVLTGAAVALAARRDLEASLWSARPGPAGAGGRLRTPWGLALHEHGLTILGWAVGTAVLMGAYGLLTQPMIDALRDMPELQGYLRAAEEVVDTVVATFAMLLGALAVASVLQAAGGLRTAEEQGLLSQQLAGPVSRTGWWWTHAVVIALGALLVVLVGGAALAGSIVVSTDDAGRFGELFAAGLAQLPAVVLFLGLVTLLLGWVPEHRGLVWLPFAAALVIGWLGPALDLPQWVMDVAPLTAVGQVPVDDFRLGAAAVLVLLGVVLSALGAIGLRRRDIPRV
ncbi:hypothetical protein I6I18_08795 [Kytococcus sedentarius]|uniref:Exporter of polyketide antibiotics n=1 Tax=Kytococcus sedentarius (strain ATCC 14392 / DSM 20547 / JCM 11482 / CCUG 33030 / NBRC 15357 / NCTC 11040 / CCM 314 / 541) TaxID=478801 RepID=C7NLU8_KYTSD|nr:exporter of polyketide antibiotics [Kytococcus sedentarius]ACV07197.1 putative exporter of polyketide antibiotics [Kytococcus sedentarius DSM 20547]QQB63171.1 hypothetical protein I6I18_08795 [Kytococcus sedentarius]STX13968.1 ABC-2 family transporter protein [Kytococcus sedentarius]